MDCRLKEIAVKTVTLISIIVFCILTIFNIFFIVTVTNFAENVFITPTTSISFVSSLILDIALLCLFKKLSKHNKINIKFAIIIALLIYALISAIWINLSKVKPIDDSESVNNLAIDLANGNMESIRTSEYIEKYPNQIGMITIFAFFYKIFHSNNFKIIQYLNIVSNILTIIFMYFILNKLSKKYNINKVAYFASILTFVPLIMLTTYVYGDYLGLMLSVIGIYLIIDYKESNKKTKLILSATFMALAYFTKMNYIIVTISILIYLIVYLIEEKEKNKIYKSILSIIIFAVISILPLSIVKTAWVKKFNYDKEQSIPTSVWIYLGMSESYRAERMV